MYIFLQNGQGFFSPHDWVLAENLSAAVPSAVLHIVHDSGLLIYLVVICSILDLTHSLLRLLAPGKAGSSLFVTFIDSAMRVLSSLPMFVSSCVSIPGSKCIQNRYRQFQVEMATYYFSEGIGIELRTTLFGVFFFSPNACLSVIVIV